MVRLRAAHPGLALLRLLRHGRQAIGHQLDCIAGMARGSLGNIVPGWPVEPGEHRKVRMSTTTLTMENFESTVTGDGITLVDFWAEWCGPCKMFAPIFEQAATENPDMTFAKVDTEVEQQLAGALRIMSIPTLMIFRDGIQLFSQAGALPKSALDDLIRQVRDLDMDAVRAEIAKQEQQNDA
jgi:thioredoxin 1